MQRRIVQERVLAHCMHDSSLLRLLHATVSIVGSLRELALLIMLPSTSSPRTENFTETFNRQGFCQQDLHEAMGGRIFAS